MAAPAVSFSVAGSDQALALFQRKQEEVLAAILAQMDVENAKLGRYIQTEKLSGQVLHRVTGKLADSVRLVPASQQGPTIEGGVAAAGGPAWYGRLHEYGTSRSYPIVAVNKQALAFVMGGKQVIVKSVMHPPIQQRAFMAPSLEENRAAIVAALQSAVDRVITQLRKAA